MSRGGLWRAVAMSVALSSAAWLTACGAHPRDGYIALGSVDGARVYGSLTVESGYYGIEIIKDGNVICDGLAGLGMVGTGADAHGISACDDYTPKAMTFAVAVSKSRTPPTFCSGTSGAPIPTVLFHTPSTWPVDVVAASGEENWGAVTSCSDLADTD